MSDLVRLFHHQWSLPVLVELLRGPDKRYAALARRLKVSRQTLTDTLEALSAQGLVEGGGGDYRLTREGARAAELRVCDWLVGKLRALPGSAGLGAPGGYRGPESHGARVCCRARVRRRPAAGRPRASVVRAFSVGASGSPVSGSRPLGHSRESAS